jgi:hypothetical protein
MDKQSGQRTANRFSSPNGAQMSAMNGARALGQYQPNDSSCDHALHGLPYVLLM